MNAHMEVYGKLYDILEGNVQKQQMSMPVSKNVYLEYLQNPPYYMDCLRTKDYSNREFLETCYIQLFGRMPDAAINWENDIQTLEPSEFQARLLTFLMTSVEFQMKGSRVVNERVIFENCASYQKQSRAVRVMQGFKSRLLRRIYIFFHPYYMKLSDKNRNFLKRTFKRFLER